MEEEEEAFATDNTDCADYEGGDASLHFDNLVVGTGGNPNTKSGTGIARRHNISTTVSFITGQ